MAEESDSPVVAACNRIFADDSAFNESDLSFVDFDSFSSHDDTPGTYN